MVLPKLPDPTPACAQLYRAIYREPWPVGWRVEWKPTLGRMLAENIWRDDTAGACEVKGKRKTILLSYFAAVVESHTDQLVRGQLVQELSAEPPDPWRFAGVWETVIHEFTHMRHLGLEHGAKFDRLLRKAKQTLTALPSRPGKRVASTISEVNSDDAVCAA